MAEHILRKLEERIVVMVSELENVRKELEHANQEITILKAEKRYHREKIETMIALLDVFSETKESCMLDFMHEHGDSDVITVS